MSKKNYNINLQDSSYYISLNIIKKKQQQQFDNLILKPPPPPPTPTNRTTYLRANSNTKSTNKSTSRQHYYYNQSQQLQQSPYDELLNRNNRTIDKLRQRLKLVNEISNLNQRLTHNINLKKNEPSTYYYNYKIPKTNKFKIDISTTPIIKTPYTTKDNRKETVLKPPFVKRSFSSTDDYSIKKSEFILPKKKFNNYFMQPQFNSSFSLEKPSCLNETKEDGSLVSSFNLSSSSIKMLKSSSSLDLDKLSVNKFFKLDTINYNTKKSSQKLANNNYTINPKSSELNKLLKNRKEFNPVFSKPNLSINESAQMSSIRSMGSNELDMYIDSLIKQFRLKSKLINTNCVNISNTATVSSSSAEGKSTQVEDEANTTEINEDDDDDDDVVVNEKELDSNNKIQAETTNDEEAEEEKDDNNDEDNSTFINYTHSYEIDDINECDSTDLSLVDADDDLTFSITNNTNTNTNTKN